MKIGIISDIHGYPERFNRAMEYLKDCSMILCAGDILYHGPRNPILEGYNPKGLIEIINKNEIPMLTDRGNCDADVDQMVLNIPILSPMVVYERENIRFVVLHGHEYDEERIRDIARIYKADIMVLGHTHVKRCESYLEGLIINPGSTSLPKDNTPSIAVFEDGEIRFINIDNGEVIEKKYL